MVWEAQRRTRNTTTGRPIVQLDGCPNRNRVSQLPARASDQDPPTFSPAVSPATGISPQLCAFPCAGVIGGKGSCLLGEEKLVLRIREAKDQG